VRIRGHFPGSAMGQTMDLSAFATRLTTERSLAAGEVVSLDLALTDGGEPLRTSAVVWEAGPGDVVCVFLRLGELDFLRLRDYVEGLLPGAA